MVSTVISDNYNHTATIDALKGIFTLVPFLACLIFAYWILSYNYELMIPFLWGYIISFILSAGFGFDAFYIEMLNRKELSSVSQLGQYDKILIWILNSFITGAFAMTYFKRYPRFVTLTILLFSFYALLAGSRGSFLIIFIVSVILIIIFLLTRGLPWDGKIWQQRLEGKIPRFIILFFILIFLAKNIYEVAVTKGYLGQAEFIKYQMQKNSKIGLFSGRGEIISAFLAVRDSPLLGHGSYAKDDKGYGYQGALLAGYDKVLMRWYEYNSGKDYIPTHSALWQAWVWNGLAGGIFWIYILVWILVKFSRKYLFEFPDYMAYLLLSIFGLFWAILFSPFSQKPFLAMSIMFIVVLMKEVDNFSDLKEF
jgi:O-antigen ligase